MRPLSLALVVLAACAACSQTTYVLVVLKVTSGLPPIARLQLSASDGVSQSTAEAPAAPVPQGINFPETYVISAPNDSKSIVVGVTGLDVNGTTVARGGGTLTIRAHVQNAITVVLSQPCDSALDCDPQGVCSGALICGGTGACVAGSGSALEDGTDCGEDGGVCQAGACGPAVPCLSNLDCDPTSYCAGAVLCSDGGVCLPGDGVVLSDQTACGTDGGLCLGGACVIPSHCASIRDCEPAGVCSGAVTCTDGGLCLPGSGTVAKNGTSCGRDGGLCEGGGCLIPYCGCGIVVPPEQCDFGADGGPFGLGDNNSGVCTKACRWAVCGDGFVNLDALPDGGYLKEACDWGSGADGGACTGPDGGCNSDTLPNHCRSNCVLPSCGDGVVDQGERCDLGTNLPDGGGNGKDDGCNSSCTLIGQVTVFAGTADAGYRDGPPAQAQFDTLESLALVDGTFYVPDFDNDVIRAVPLDGGSVSTLAGEPGLAGNQDATGSLATFDLPQYIAPLGDGLAVTEQRPSGGYDIRSVTLGGEVELLAGAGSELCSSSPQALEGVDFMSGLTTVAADGNDLLIGDLLCGVELIDPDAGTMEPAYPGQSAFSVTIYRGVLATDAGIYVLVAGSMNSNATFLELVDPDTGNATPIAGSTSDAGLVDGTGSAAEFDFSQGLCTDGRFVFVPDEGSGALRQVNPATGAVETLAGNGSTQTAVGVGRAASVGPVSGCAWDPVSADVFVASGNQILRVH